MLTLARVAWARVARVRVARVARVRVARVRVARVRVARVRVARVRVARVRVARVAGGAGAGGAGAGGAGAGGAGAASNGRRWRIAVDADTCIGSGMCASIAPDRFRLEGSTSRPLVELTGEEDGVIDAAESCPVEAISVRNAETGELVAPEF